MARRICGSGPVLVCCLESISGVRMLECPPAGIPRELSSSETVGFAMSCDCGEKVEEIEDDLAAGVRIDTDGNECGEGVGSKLRVYRTVSIFLYKRLARGIDAFRTLFADLEELISFPGNNSSRKSAPAPF